MTLTQHAFRLALWAAGCVGLAFVIFALTGCAWVNGAVSGGTNYLAGSESQAAANVKALDDLKVNTWAQLGCAIPYGAMVRNATANPNLPMAIVDLCGLPAGINVIKSTSGLELTSGTGPTTIASPAPATATPE